MNQYKELLKKTVRLAITRLLIVAGAGAVCAGIYLAADGVSQEKTAAERKLAEENNRLQMLKTQFEKAGVADKRYMELVGTRLQPNFAMIAIDEPWLKSVVDRYRFDRKDTILDPATEEESDKPQLQQLSHKILVRKPVEFKFKAISDTHVFSFIDELQRGLLPGIVIVDSLHLKRTADITQETLSAAQQGLTPLSVEGKITFTWLGVVPKTASKTATGGTQ